MVLLALIIIGKGGASGNTLSVFNPGETSLLGVSGGGVLGGVLLGVLLFVGFEAAASIGEESADPHRTIPRAVLWTVGVSALFFALMAYAFSIGYGKAAVSKGAWAFDPAAVDTMATKYVGSWYATIIDLVVILDATALALAICVTIGRGYFALARDGLLPRAFARTSRHNTPWVGNLMVAVGGVGLVILSVTANYASQFVFPGPDGKPVPLFPSDEFATLIMAATVGSFAVELVYLVLSVVAIRLLMRHGGQWWQYLIVVVAVATPLLGFYGALKPGPHNGANYNYEALYWTIGLLVVAAVWFAIVRATRPEQVRNAAAHAAQHRGVPPLDENLDFTPAPEDTVI
jgi:amino acid transporter